MAAQKLDVSSLDCCIFDFDGTIYPRLLLADAAAIFFKKIRDNTSLTRLKVLAEKSESQPFDVTLVEFTQLIDGIDAVGFDSICCSLLDSVYPSFGKVMETLRTFGLPCYLSSLTTKAVASAVAKKYGFVDYTFFDYPIVSSNGRSIYSALSSTSPLLLDFFNFKQHACVNKNILPSSFLYAGDSEQDLCLFREAKISVGVNPKKELLNLDLILADKDDPWRTFLTLIE